MGFIQGGSRQAATRPVLAALVWFGLGFAALGAVAPGARAGDAPPFAVSPAPAPGGSEAGAAGSDEVPEDPPEGRAEMTFLQMLRFGLEINIAIGVLGFAGLFLFFFFILETRPGRLAPKWIIGRVEDALAAGAPARAAESLERDPSLLAAVAAAGLRQAGGAPERIESALEAAGRRTLGRLRQRVNYLANIGVLTPMLGLLGTVAGLMKAFNVLGAEQLGEGYRAALLGSAIGEAMVTTAVGLVVGIPAMALHFIALDRLGRIGDRLETATEQLAEAIERGNRK